MNGPSFRIYIDESGEEGFVFRPDGSFGDTEDKYARLLLLVCYRHKGALLGYGLKFWPGDFEGLKWKTRSYLRLPRA